MHFLPSCVVAFSAVSAVPWPPGVFPFPFLDVQLPGRQPSASAHPAVAAVGLFAALAGAGASAAGAGALPAAAAVAGRMAALRRDFEQADAERKRLQAELAQTTQRPQRSEADKAALGEQLSASQATAAARVTTSRPSKALPPDPAAAASRCAPAVQRPARRARLQRRADARRQPAQSAVGCRSSPSAANRHAVHRPILALEPIALSMPGTRWCGQAAPLPEGFAAADHGGVLDKAAGKSLGMRVAGALTRPSGQQCRA